MSLITADGIRYTIENYENRSYLKINNVQPNDYGTYMCSANAMNKLNRTIAVYQIVDLLVGLPLSRQTINGSKWTVLSCLNSCFYVF